MFTRVLLLWPLLAASLVACAANVQGNATDASPRDAGPDDVALGPIEGCPAQSGSVRGRWETVAVPDGYSARARATVVPAGRQLAVIGGYDTRAVVTDNWRFDPTSGQWSRLASAGLTTESRSLTAVWMPEAQEIFLWSGLERRGVRLGLDGSSRELPTSRAPRTLVQRAVSVAGMVMVGGAIADGDHNEFALYDPRSDRWETVLAPREQTARGSYTMVAAANEVIVWGGSDATSDTGIPRNDGWRFDVAARRWSSVSRNSAPAPRWGHAAWWIGDALLVWGGNNGSITLRSGGRYFAAPDAWVASQARGAPGPLNGVGSFEHPGVWTGSDLYVWTLTPGGEVGAGRFDPRSDRWFAADPPPQATRRRESTSVWVDCGLYVVGGRDVQRWEFTREVVRWVP